MLKIWKWTTCIELMWTTEKQWVNVAGTQNMFKVLWWIVYRTTSTRNMPHTELTMLLRYMHYIMFSSVADIYFKRVWLIVLSGYTFVYMQSSRYNIHYKIIYFRLYQRMFYQYKLCCAIVVNFDFLLIWCKILSCCSNKTVSRLRRARQFIIVKADGSISRWGNGCCHITSRWKRSS